MDGMLVQSCGRMGARVIKATIEHDMARMGCFAWEQFGMLMMIG